MYGGWSFLAGTAETLKNCYGLHMYFGKQSNWTRKKKELLIQNKTTHIKGLSWTHMKTADVDRFTCSSASINTF